MVTRASQRGSTDAPAETPAAPADGTPPPAGDQTPPEGEKPPTHKPAAEAPLKLTPAEWGRRKGLHFAPSERQPWVEAHSREFHAEADALHGWTEHAHHYQPIPLGDDKFDTSNVFTLTEEDYDAARKAASEYPACGPHKPALALLEGRAEPKSVKEARADELEKAKLAKVARAEQRKAMR